MKHTESCEKQTQKIKQAIAEYEAKWPGYCRSCRGAGYLISYQSVPYGSTSASFEVTDFCPNCIEKDKCPRCGKTVFEIDGDFDESPFNCPECGWKEGEPTCPELDDCGCWELPESLSNHIADNWPYFD